MRKLTLAALLVLVGGCAADLSATDSDNAFAALIGTPVGISQNGMPRPGMSANGLSVTGMNAGGIHSKQLLPNPLANQPLTYQGKGTTLSLAAQTWMGNVTDSNNMRPQLLRYMIHCALPTGQTIAGVDSYRNPYAFDGSLGLLPGWSSSALQISNEEWISACVMAHVNDYGTQVQILVQGWNAAVLDTQSTTVAQFPHFEGAYWGNIFGDLEQTKLSTCIGDANTNPFVVGRSCEYNQCPPMSTLDPSAVDININTGSGQVSGNNFCSDVCNFVVNPFNGERTIQFCQGLPAIAIYNQGRPQVWVGYDSAYLAQDQGASEAQLLEDLSNTSPHLNYDYGHMEKFTTSGSTLALAPSGTSPAILYRCDYNAIMHKLSLDGCSGGAANIGRLGVVLRRPHLHMSTPLYEVLLIRGGTAYYRYTTDTTELAAWKRGGFVSGPDSMANGVFAYVAMGEAANDF